MGNMTILNHQKNSKLTFKKVEKLCKKKLIEETFKKGKTIKSFPFKIIYNFTSFEDKTPVQTLTSVPKRNVKLATGRNTIKRRIKEVFRLNKQNIYDFCEQENTKLAIIIIYIGKKEQSSYEMIEKKLTKGLTLLHEKISSQEK
jgi:ribonuclease P protein component